MGIWHKDGHNENFMVHPTTWDVKILDFGISSMFTSQANRNMLKSGLMEQVANSFASNNTLPPLTRAQARRLAMMIQQNTSKAGEYNLLNNHFYNTEQRIRNMITH